MNVPPCGERSQLHHEFATVARGDMGVCLRVCGFCGVLEVVNLDKLRAAYFVPVGLRDTLPWAIPVAPYGARTLREQVDAALFALYTKATEGEARAWEDFWDGEPEDQGIVLRCGDAAIAALARETGLDIATVGATKTHPEKT